MLRTLLIAGMVMTLPACTWLGARARINPSSIAYYPGTAWDSNADKASIDAAPSPTRVEAGRDGRRVLRTPCILTGGVYDSKQGAIDLDCFAFPDDRTRPAYDLASGFDALKETDADKKAAMLDRARFDRNRLAAVLLKHADDACKIEKGRLVAVQSSSNFLLSFLTQSFSGASTIVGGDRAKSILSGLATLSAGTQDNVNATFYRNQLTTAIGRSIDQERSRLLEGINSSRTQSIDAHSVDEMIMAVNRYHHACSFEHGLQVLIDAATDAKGATSALESRSRDRAIEELRERRRDLLALRKQITGTSESDESRRAEILEDIKEVDDKLQGLALARADKLLTEPSAGDTSEVHPPANDVAEDEADAAGAVEAEAEAKNKNKNKKPK
ncbi:hypothetical protein [Sphingomonas sp.]|jgi:hypothetical protein|uniref:hypothetical protein n=1 Tax=Sphingomonas sp. TaxID=28214 RepID=UPI002DE952A0|nr:hypothetical protein [Sphingomonas sp.]